jgi:amino acid transporter
MLSFVCVIVYDLFEWKRICVGFVLLVYVCIAVGDPALRRKSKDWLDWNQDNVSERVTCLSADCCFSELAL